MKRYVFFIPVLIIIYILTINMEKVNDGLTSFDESTDEVINVNLYINEEVEILELEDYVIGVVACEMPVSFEREALKAMSIASRTYALSRMKNNIIETTKIEQCFNNISEMEKKWGDSFNEYYTLIKTIVLETKGKYVSYEGQPIKAFYFSTSNGYTENVENVFSEQLNYLISVESSWDKNVKTYLKEITIDEKEFMQILNLDNIEKIEINSRFNSGRVNKIQVNNNEYTGVEFRKLVGIRSTDFDIEYNNGEIKITTRGYGHGVGMSQYGANEMAKLGYKYDEILKYYYKNTSISSV